MFHIIFKIYRPYFPNRIKCLIFVIQLRVVARCENFGVFNAKAKDIYCIITNATYRFKYAVQ